MSYLFRFVNCLAIAFIFVACSTTFDALKRPIEKTQKTTKKNIPHSKMKGSEPSLENAEDTIDSFPIIRNEDVEKWISYFQTTGHRSFIKWMERGAPFKATIEEALEKEGVPITLYYMALVESGFVHHALSTANASGPWQFLKDTGLQYGLKSNDWLDQRRDPEKSTHAAVAYLRDLRQKFGDWYLTLAAYNGGPRNINDAIKKGETNDFWKLKKAGLLKKETGEFVPKVIAAAILGNDPLKFGFPAKIADARPPFPDSVIKIKKPVKIKEIARKLSIPLAQLKEWNPELLKDMTPPRKYSSPGGYALRVREEYVERFSEIESQLTYVDIKEFHIHRIAKGDTLGKLAKRYHVSVETLLQVNPQVHSHKIAIGTKISVPLLETHT